MKMSSTQRYFKRMAGQGVVCKGDISPVIANSGRPLMFVNTEIRNSVVHSAARKEIALS